MSGSLLLIAVVWIVLLAPLLLRHQSPVRRTAQALTQTRIVYRGGASLKPRRRLQPAAESFQRSDVDEELEFVEAEPEFILIDDSSSATATGHASAAGESLGAPAETLEADIIDAVVVGDDAAGGGDADAGADAVDAEVADAGDGDAVDRTARTEKLLEEGAGTSAVASSQEPAEAPSHTSVVDNPAMGDGTQHPELSHTARTDAASGFLSHDETDTGVFSPIRLLNSTADIPEAYLRGSDVDTSITAAEESEGAVGAEGAADSPEVATHTQQPGTAASAEDNTPPVELSAELDDEDIKYLAARKGRGVYDPVASQQAAAKRQKRRKQVLSVFVALCAITGIVSVILGSMMWVSFAVAVALTALYLYFLRRSALEEARTRARRLARMRRARMGVRNTQDAELGVPNRLRRPGAIIIETDEADLTFQHLEYIDSREYFADDPSTGMEEHRNRRDRIRAV